MPPQSPVVEDIPRERREKLAKAVRQLHVREHRQLQSNPRGGLLEFIRYFWHVLEPVDPFIEGWPLECLCAHLEGISNGDMVEINGVTRLLNRLNVNVPPGFMKSLCTNVFFPAWEWGPLGRPHLRYIAFSYASELTERDNAKFRDLVTSDAYRELWGHVFRVVGDGKIRVTNDQTGFKFASSLGGVGTGERGHRVLCLPGAEPILTDRGWLPIGEVVEQRLPVRVAGLNHETNKVEWQAIEEYERNPGNEIVEVACEGSTLRCTRDHPVYVQGRGYARADSLKGGEALVWTGGHFDLSLVQSRDPAQAQPSQEVLQQAMPHRGRAPAFPRDQQSPLRGVRHAGLSAASPSQAHAEATVLQPQMPRHLEQGSEQSGLYGLTQSGVCLLQQAVSAAQPEDKVLFTQVRRGTNPRRNARALAGRSNMPSVFGTFHCALPEATLLHAQLRQHRAQSAHRREGEWTLCPRGGFTQVPARLEQEPQGPDKGARRQSLPNLRARSRAGKATTRSPHRLRQGQPGPQQSHHALSLLPRETARRQEGAAETCTRIVRSVKIIGREDVVYNVRVGPHHNYFASGLLVHNCDDLNKIKGTAESDESRNSTSTWATEAMQNRLNDLQRDAIINIQQRTHEEDVSGTILKQLADEYCALILPMQYEPNRHFTHYTGWNEGQDPRQDSGELAWPERYPSEVLQSFKRNAYLWSGQYQQNPVPRGGGLFKDDWWQVHEVQRSEGGVIKFVPPIAPIFVLASLDTAYSEKEENDPSALTVWAVHDNQITKRRNILMVDAWAKMLPHLSGPRQDPHPNEHPAVFRRRAMQKWGLAEWVADTCTRRRVNLLIVENKNRAPDVIKEIKKLFADRDWGIRSIDIRGDKWGRAHAITDIFTDEMVHAPAEITEDGSVIWLDWAQDAMTEISRFPRGGHDDILDSMTMAMKYLRDNGYAIRSEEQSSHERAQMMRGHQKRTAIYPV